MAKTTKWVLGESLKKLLQEKSLDKITVVDIVKDSNINRQTFYYHFQDIYDLVEWVLTEENLETMGGKATYLTWQQGYWSILNYAKKNKQFILNIYYSSSRDTLSRFLYDTTYRLLINAIDEQARDMRVKEEDKAFIANYYKYGFVGLTLEWIGNGMKEDPQKMVERLSVLIHGDIIKALKRFRIDRKMNIDL